MKRLVYTAFGVITSLILVVSVFASNAERDRSVDNKAAGEDMAAS